jgi:hypothetical protein
MIGDGQSISRNRIAERIGRKNPTQSRHSILVYETMAAIDATMTALAAGVCSMWMSR